MSLDDLDRVHRLAGDRPSAPLPAKADAPALLDRLAVQPDAAAEIMAGWPDPDSPCGLRSCAGCSTARSPWSAPLSGATAGCRPIRSRLASGRRMHGEGWPVMQSRLTLRARGAIYELGRL